MKKILSIVIAAAMLLAISVPAFAATATIDQSTSGGVGNSSVVTDRSGISGTFTVSYPAETTHLLGHRKYRNRLHCIEYACERK